MTPTDTRIYQRPPTTSHDIEWATQDVYLSIFTTREIESGYPDTSGVSRIWDRQVYTSGIVNKLLMWILKWWLKSPRLKWWLKHSRLGGTSGDLSHEWWSRTVDDPHAK